MAWLLRMSWMLVKMISEAYYTQYCSWTNVLVYLVHALTKYSSTCLPHVDGLSDISTCYSSQCTLVVHHWLSYCNVTLFQKGLQEPQGYNHANRIMENNTLCTTQFNIWWHNRWVTSMHSFCEDLWPRVFGHTHIHAQITHTYIHKHTQTNVTECITLRA